MGTAVQQLHRQLHRQCERRNENERSQERVLQRDSMTAKGKRQVHLVMKLAVNKQDQEAVIPHYRLCRVITRKTDCVRWMGRVLSALGGFLVQRFSLASVCLSMSR